MGARHPQDLIARMGISKYDLVTACHYLIRSGVVKRPADAIRYIEDNDIKLEDVIEQYIEAMRTSNLEDLEIDESKL